MQQQDMSRDSLSRQVDMTILQAGDEYSESEDGDEYSESEDSESDLSDNHPNLHQKLHEDLIICPSRHELLEKLPVNIRLELKKGYADISHHLARLILGEERYNAILNQCDGDSTPLFISDGQRVIFFWKVKNVSYSPADEPYATRLVESAGIIRHQLGHRLCWAYANCDLVSMTHVLYGLDDSFRPLSPNYLCENASPKKLNTFQDPKHWCYEHNILDTLVFIKNRGVPIERPEEKIFNCRKGGVYGSDYRKIKNIYHYSTLEEALVRLKTHPVVAALELFEGWDKKGIYRGPFNGGKYMGVHFVVMIGCEQKEGETVVVCKSSNGKHAGRRGYILVSVDVMIMAVAGSRKFEPSDPDGGKLVIENNPVYLLSEFYSVDVDVGAKGKRYISKEEYDKNLKFKIDKKTRREIWDSMCN